MVSPLSAGRGALRSTVSPPFFTSPLSQNLPLCNRLLSGKEPSSSPRRCLAHDHFPIAKNGNLSFFFPCRGQFYKKGGWPLVRAPPSRAPDWLFEGSRSLPTSPQMNPFFSSEKVSGSLPFHVALSARDFSRWARDNLLNFIFYSLLLSLLPSESFYVILFLSPRYAIGAKLPSPPPGQTP